MRTGFNPNRHADAPTWPKIIAAVITHLPDQDDGYHAKRMEVVKTSLTLLRNNAGQDLPVLVWDNGSCDELIDWLRTDYKPEYRFISHNVGKGSARACIMHMLPPDTVVCFADDDMLYYPNWLAPQLELLNGYPNVGVVSGYPVRTQFRWGNRSTMEWAQTHAEVQIGRFIPDEWERDFCTSVGRDWKFHQGYTARDMDIRLRYHGLDAYATAHHCQFVTIAARISPLCCYQAPLMGDEKPFDMAIDAAGLLRLTTTQRLVRHIGNVLDEQIRKELTSWRDKYVQHM